jgi:hypothetical protein
MNFILKQLLIITCIFLIITWFQNIDDKKYNKIRNTFYDKYKFPILVSAIIGLIINLSDIILTNELCNNNEENITEITFITPIKKVIEKSNNNLIRPLSNDNITDQQIYTSLPDF